MALDFGGSYIDAVVEYCENNHMQEYEDLVKSLDPILIKKIGAEFLRKNYIPNRKIENPISEFFEDV